MSVTMCERLIFFRKVEFNILRFLYFISVFQVLKDVDTLQMEDNEKVEIEYQGPVSSSVADDDENAQSEEASVPVQERVSTERSEVKSEVRQRSIPPPGSGQGIYEIDPILSSYRQHLDYR